MAQRVEKVAQRRVEERNEKLKSERKTRFNLKSNPFFSRPPELITKDFARLQQEQQEYIAPQRVLITTPTNVIDSISSNDNHQASSIFNTQSSPVTEKNSKQTITKIVKKTKKLFNSADDDDDDESGRPAASVIETNQNSRSHLYHSPSASIRRPIIKSASTRHITPAEATMLGAIKKMKLIFPLNYKSKYRHLFLVDKIAYIYIQLVIMLGHKTMTSGQFRSFTKYIILFF